MQLLGVIPARYASSRFPGKPLARIAGKPMIQRVYEQALKATSLAEVVVATDDIRIADAVIAFGGRVTMTDAGHPSGTDRCAEALRNSTTSYAGVINIQGDEPFIAPEQIDLVAETLQEEGVQIATLVKKIASYEELSNPNSPKVVLAANGDALYFSRQPLPYLKGIPETDWCLHHPYYKHIGLYGYSAAILPLLTALAPGILEKAESLEQLRWLEQGYSIRTRLTTLETIAVDTPDDLRKAEAFAALTT